MKKFLFGLVILFCCIIGGCSNSKQQLSKLENNIKVDTVTLYNDIVVCEAKDNFDPNDKGLDIYAVVMNMDSNPALAKEYYRMLKIAEPSKKGLKLTYEDGTVLYLIENYEGKTDTLTTEKLRYNYVTSEQRNNYLELLEKVY